MLIMTRKGNKLSPALRCAICDKPIFSAKLGAVVYPRGIEQGEMFRICLTHKGLCLSEATANMETDHGPALCTELTAYLKSLLSDSGASQDQ